METKGCTRCRQIKPLEEFYFNARDQIYLSRCIICTRRDSRERFQKKKAYIKSQRRTYRTSEAGRATDRRARRKYPDKTRARQMVKDRLPSASTMTCSCGKQAVSYHHHNGYGPGHELDVIALCRWCHDVEDAKQRMQRLLATD